MKVAEADARELFIGLGFNKAAVTGWKKDVLEKKLNNDALQRVPDEGKAEKLPKKLKALYEQITAAQEDDVKVEVGVAGKAPAKKAEPVKAAAGKKGGKKTPPPEEEDDEDDDDSEEEDEDDAADDDDEGEADSDDAEEEEDAEQEDVEEDPEPEEDDVEEDLDEDEDAEEDDEESEDSEDEEDEDETDSDDDESEEEDEEDEDMPATKKAPKKGDKGKAVEKAAKTGKSVKGGENGKPVKAGKDGKNKSAFKRGNGDGGPGKLETIRTLLLQATAAKPLSKNRLLELMQKKFPDTEEKALKTTINCQVGYQLKSKGWKIDKSEKGMWMDPKKNGKLLKDS